MIREGLSVLVAMGDQVMIPDGLGALSPTLPSNISPPEASGYTDLNGFNASSTPGSWSGSPSITGEWFLNGSPTGITDRDHLFTGLTPGDELFWRETATSPYGSSTIDSNTVTYIGESEWDFSSGELVYKGRATPLAFSRASAATRWNEDGELVYGPENLIPSSNDLTSWSDTGTPFKTYSATGGPDNGGNTVIQNISASNYITLNHPAPPHGEYSVGLWVTRFSPNPGRISISNPSSDSLGLWTVAVNDLADWEFITEDHPAVTVVNPFVATTGSGGLRIGSAMGSNIRIKVARVQTNRGSTLSDYIVTNGGAAYGLRIDYDPATGECLGSLWEGQSTNKVTVYNASPTDLSGMQTGGGGDTPPTLTLVDDADELELAGLSQVCAGNVYKLDNTAGTGIGYAYIAGNSGNTNTHYGSIFVRGGSGRLGSAVSSSAPGSIAFDASDHFRRVWTNAMTPSSNLTRVLIGANVGQIIYFVIAQWEEGGVSSPIITEGSSAIRADDVGDVNDMSWFNPSHGVFICKVRAYPGSVNSADRRVMQLYTSNSIIHMLLGDSGANYPIGKVGGNSANAGTTGTSSSIWEYLAISYDSSGNCYFSRRIGNSPAVASGPIGAFTPGDDIKLTLGTKLNGHLASLRYEPRLITSGAELQAILDALPAV